ncbi:MAG: XRE family transcriptional regulator [Lachnospiraceae bacterium]|nr:XRE family transcriptional regulator [Lachnospiraceae bacterium]
MDNSLLAVRGINHKYIVVEWRKSASLRIAIATFLCILSPAPLFLLAGMAEFGVLPMSEDLAGGVGLVVLLLLAAVAVGIYLSCGFRNAPYDFLEKEIFEVEYGVRGMVAERQKLYRNTYVRFNILGVCLCVISPLPLFVAMGMEDEFLATVQLTVTMLIVAVGVFFMLVAGVRWAGMQKLLQEGEFTVREKEKNGVKEKIGQIYWPVVTAVYLGWSFITEDWGMTWIIWPVAGVLFVGILGIYGLWSEKEKG